MIVFLTSLTHPDNSPDLQRSDELIAASLASITRQTDSDYCVIVVGERPPAIELPPSVEFITVDFPATDHSGTFHLNKGAKLGVGLLRARELGADFIMVFDYDDYVHRDIAAFVNAHPAAQGWYLPDGLLYSKQRNSYRRRSGFNRRCGTSHIVPLNAYRIPEELTLDAPFDEVCEAFGDEAVDALGKHRMLRELMANRGFELQPLPFYGAMYTVETFANISGTRMTWFSRPLRKQLAEEFGVKSSVSRLRSWMYCIDPMPIVRGVRVRLTDSKRPLWERLFTRRIGFQGPTQ